MEIADTKALEVSGDNPMALQSKLFHGDPKLEAAAVSDPAHIMPGVCGPHVAKIQIALQTIDGATISTDELRSELYGPSTASAVLAFKQKRRRDCSRVASRIARGGTAPILPLYPQSVAGQGSSKKQPLSRELPQNHDAVRKRSLCGKRIADRAPVPSGDFSWRKCCSG